MRSIGCGRGLNAIAVLQDSDAPPIVSVVNDALEDQRVGAGWGIQKTAGKDLACAATTAALRT